MMDYFPYMINIDFNLPTSMVMPANLMFFENTLYLSNIYYDIMTISFERFSFKFDTYEYDPVVSVNLPLISHWHARLNYAFDWMFPLLPQGTINFDVHNVAFKSIIHMKAGTDGSI